MSSEGDPGADLRQRMAEVVAAHGPWTAHSIHLGHGVRTFSKTRNAKLLTTMQFIRTLARKPFDQLRVLDLGCLEGVYAIEMALQGAQAVGIEARTANIAKARFAKSVLGLDNVEFYQDDVRDISPERYGVFDFVICAGLLYHLDAPDLLPFLERCSAMCRGHFILDTHIACQPSEKFCHNDYWYHGYTFQELAASAPDASIEGHPWASHKNRVSFVLTRPSLFAALVNAGFDTVAEGAYPYHGFPFNDYVFAISGKAQPMAWKSGPELGTVRLPPRPEQDTRATQNPYLRDNTTAHPRSDFVVPSELRGAWYRSLNSLARRFLGRGPAAHR